MMALLLGNMGRSRVGNQPDGTLFATALGSAGATTVTATC